MGHVYVSTPDLDENRSVWTEGQAPYVPQPALSGSIDADVVIIGGGFTGLSTAWHILERFPQRRVVLLEGRVVGNGASGRNGGMVLNWIYGIDGGSPEGDKKIYDLTRSGIDFIEGLIRDHQLPVRFSRDGHMEVFTRNHTAEEGQAWVEQRASWGVPVRWLNAAEVKSKINLEGVVGALFEEGTARLNGLDYVRAWRTLLLSRGLILHEHSPVLKIEEGRTVVVTTPKGEVRAPALVLATNAYTPKLGYFRNNIAPIHSYVLATEVLPPEVREKIGWNIGGFSDDYDRIAYGTLTRDGRIVFGGGGNSSYAYLYGGGTGNPPEKPASYQAILDHLRRYFPQLGDVRVDYRWAGPVALTLDRSPSIGVRGDNNNVYYAVGYCGHGITLGNVAGRILADLYADHHEPWRDFPFYNRRLHYMPGEPFRYIGYHAYTTLTGRSPRRYR